MTSRPRWPSALAPAFERLGRRNVVDHHVDALAAGQVQQLLGDAAVARIDHVVGAGFAAGVEFVRLGVDRDDARPSPISPS